MGRVQVATSFYIADPIRETARPLTAPTVRLTLPHTKFTSAVTVDNVIFGFEDRSLQVLLIQRGAEPFLHHWALPGDFIHGNEDLDAAAERVLSELTGLQDVYLEQVRSFGNPIRHPDGRVITVAYYSLIGRSEHPVSPQGWAERAGYHAIDQLPDLAFDHREILDTCLARLRERVRTRPIGFELLPANFTLSELQALYESILGETLDKRNFRKKILQTGLVGPTGHLQENVSHRPAKLYAFDVAKYEKLRREGFSWEV